MLASLLLLVAFARAAVSARAELVAEKLVLRQQLAVLTRPTRKRPRLRQSDRVFWLLIQLLWQRWGQHLAVVRPETVIRWHRQGWAARPSTAKGWYSMPRLPRRPAA
jgi:putative transposase